MRSGDEQHRTVARYLPRASRVDFAEEEVGEDGHDPEEGVVFPVAHRIELLMLGRMSRVLRGHARLRGVVLAGSHTVDRSYQQAVFVRGERVDRSRVLLNWVEPMMMRVETATEIRWRASEMRC